MGYNLETCYVPSDSSQQFDEMVSNLDATLSAAQSAIDSVLEHPKLQAAVDAFHASMTAHDGMYTSPGIRSANDMLRDLGSIGSDATDRDYQKITEDKGFMFFDRNLYLVNQVGANAASQSAPPSTYTVSGLGKGITDLDLDYLNVIGTSSYDTSLVTQTGSYAQSAYKASTTATTSTTGTEYQTDGNVSMLRELFRAAGGDLNRLRDIASVGKHTGYAVVWSAVFPAEHGIDLQDSGKYDKVRAQLDYPAYDDQIGFYPTNNMALVCEETYVGVNISRDAAVLAAKAQFKLKHGTDLDYEPLLTCRVAKFKVTNVINNAPVFVTSGLDVSKLGPSNYSLGISVGGYALVIDVTGDRGTSTIGSYTPQSVAACIHAQLSDLLSVRTFGGELVLTSKVRGTSAFIQIFDTTYSASAALGIDGAIYQLQSLIGGTASRASTLRNVKTVVVAGGPAASADVDLSGALLAKVSTLGFTDEQISALVSGEFYWTALNSKSSRSRAAYDAVAATVSSAAALSRRSLISQARTATSLLVQDTIFMDLPGIDVRWFDLFLAEFGSDGLTALLAERVNVYDLSFNVPVTVGYSYLGQVLDKSSMSSGTETSQLSVEYITPFHTNASLTWKVIDRLEWLDLRLNDQDDEDFRSELLEILGIGAGVTYSISATTAMGDGSSVAKHGLLDIALRMQNPNWGQDILDTIAAASVLTIPADWLKRQEATATRMLTNVENDITDWMDDKLSSLIGTLGLEDDIAMAMRNYRRMLNGLKTVTRVLQRATAFVQRQQQVYANLLKITNAVVNYNLNMYANFEINTKFVSCYASGTGSAALGQIFALAVGLLNKAVDFINKVLTALSKVADMVFKTIDCTIQALFSFFSATLTYSTSATAAYSLLGVPMAVSLKMNCSVSLGYEPDTTMLSLLGQVQNQLRALLSSLHLSNVSFTKSAETTDSIKAKLVGTGLNDLIAQFEEKLASLANCVSGASLSAQLQATGITSLLA